ncbi:cysteine dioxygenase type 1-like isoform X2 [Polyodon spathula]|uniref:cysteine dioxygenase type 1-like isoform X2 n=1 Tax=Polyodon spathula TaxID=7913 RepID=UPI001B7E13F3|nr:cysteine dioxygenase type 1-like isoform X2 [Polyodon spathula]
MEHAASTMPENVDCLDNLIQSLHEVFSADEVDIEEVKTLMESYKSNPKDWMKFAKFDKHSSIHDHTNSHCFLKLLQGRLKETLYDWPEDQRCKQELQKRCEINFEENQCTYINDSIGLHRVENSSHCDHAVSLHLYSPPFDTCHTFDERTGHRNSVKMTFWSKYGERTPYGTASSKENN